MKREPIGGYFKRISHIVIEMKIKNEKKRNKKCSHTSHTMGFFLLCLTTMPNKWNIANAAGTHKLSKFIYFFL